MVKLPSFLKLGMKTARRYTVDVPYARKEMSNKDNSLTVELKEYISSDPELASAMRKFVDNALLEMPSVIKKRKSSLADSTVESYNEQLSDVRFYKKLRNAYYSLMFNGNAYFEVRFAGKKLKELYNIDADTMRIVTNEFGEPIEYVQKIQDKEVSFTPEEIIHISIDHLETSEWGMAFLKPLKEALHRKDVAESYLEFIITNNKLQPLVMSKTKDTMQKDELQSIKAHIEATGADPSRLSFLNFEPDEDLELLRIFTTENFNDIISYIEKQKEAILTLTQVPPIIAGHVDNSNRSNSEIQARYVFYNTLKAFNNMVAEELNYEMLRKLGWNQVRFKFPEVDRRSETDIVKIAKSLKQDLHFTNEAILEYMRENGFKIPEVDEIFEELPVQETAQEENSADFPSREPRDKTGVPKNEEMRQEDKQMGVSSDAN